MSEVIYTHDEATRLIETLEDILCENHIKVPSPEDDQREEDNDAALYGSVYSNLLDDTEAFLIEILDSSKSESGTAEKIYTHDKAAEIVEMFDDMLRGYDIEVPSPEDDEEREDDSAFYGSVYSNLLDTTENILNEILESAGVDYIPYEFSGTF